jgi:hypothetical protein
MRQVADFAGDLFPLFPDIVNWGVEISGVRGESFSGFGKVAKTANYPSGRHRLFFFLYLPVPHFFLRIAKKCVCRERLREQGVLQRKGRPVFCLRRPRNLGELTSCRLTPSYLGRASFIGPK